MRQHSFFNGFIRNFISHKRQQIKDEPTKNCNITISVSSIKLAYARDTLKKNKRNCDDDAFRRIKLKGKWEWCLNILKILCCPKQVLCNYLLSVPLLQDFFFVAKSIALMTFVVKKKKIFQCNVQAVYSSYLSKNVQCNLFSPLTQQKN